MKKMRFSFSSYETNTCSLDLKRAAAGGGNVSDEAMRSFCGSNQDIEQQAARERC